MASLSLVEIPDPVDLARERDAQHSPYLAVRYALLDLVMRRVVRAIREANAAGQTQVPIECTIAPAELPPALVAQIDALPEGIWQPLATQIAQACPVDCIYEHVKCRLAACSPHYVVAWHRTGMTVEWGLRSGQ